MDKIEQQISRFKKLDIDKIFKASVTEVKDILLEYNKDQLLHGLATDGNTLGEYADEEYANAKQDAGSLAPHGVYDFFLYGDFQDAMSIDFDLFANIIVTSTDGKTKKLEKLAEGEVFGLTEENLERFRVLILPIFQRRLRKELGY